MHTRDRVYNHSIGLPGVIATQLFFQPWFDQLWVWRFIRMSRMDQLQSVRSLCGRIKILLVLQRDVYIFPSLWLANLQRHELCNSHV